MGRIFIFITHKKIDVGKGGKSRENVGRGGKSCLLSGKKLWFSTTFSHFRVSFFPPFPTFRGARPSWTLPLDIPPTAFLAFLILDSKFCIRFI